MNKIYESCPYCLREITVKPILQKLQDRYSILCPHCLSHRSKWVGTIEEAIKSWNGYMREDDSDIFYIRLPVNSEEQVGINCWL